MDAITFNSLFFIERSDGCNQAVQVFDNGYAISVLYGNYSYSSYRFSDEKFNISHKNDYLYEVAILKDFELVMPSEIDNSGDSVLGYQSPEDINKIIQIIRNL